MPLNGSRLKLVAIAKRHLAMVDDDYRALLKEYGGCTSSRDLDDRGFDAVMARFRQLGFVSDHYKAGYGARIGMASPHQLALIRDLWPEAVADASEAHLRNWLAKQFKISDLRFINDRTAPKVITALKTMQARRREKTAKRAIAP
jgi:phage gp16-like protein